MGIKLIKHNFRALPSRGLQDNLLLRFNYGNKPFTAGNFINFTAITVKYYYLSQFKRVS